MTENIKCKKAKALETEPLLFWSEGIPSFGRDEIPSRSIS